MIKNQKIKQNYIIIKIKIQNHSTIFKQTTHFQPLELPLVGKGFSNMFLIGGVNLDGWIFCGVKKVNYRLNEQIAG